MKAGEQQLKIQCERRETVMMTGDDEVRAVGAHAVCSPFVGTKLPSVSTKVQRNGEDCAASIQLELVVDDEQFAYGVSARPSAWTGACVGSVVTQGVGRLGSERKAKTGMNE